MKKLTIVIFAICVAFASQAQVQVKNPIGDDVAQVVEIRKDVSDELDREFKSKKFKRRFKGYKRQFKGHKMNFKRGFVGRKGNFKRIGRSTSRRIRVALRN